MGRTDLHKFIFAAAPVVFCAFLNAAGQCATLPSVAAPSFWDPALRLDRPDLSSLRAIRFLTDDDYPPLDFTLADGTLMGFNVDIARAICEQLEIACTIQTRPWDTLLESLEAGKGDAVIASIAATSATRARVDFSQPYYQTPARFIVRNGSPLTNAGPNVLKDKTIGVVAGSAHEAYLKAFFRDSKLKSFASLAALQDALRGGTIDAAFGDGMTFAIWLGGQSSQNCCKFLGGPYCESRFFGEGVGIAVRKGDTDLRRAMNWALARLTSRGVYAEIYLKYFPIGFY